LLHLIQQLAAYERVPNAVTATEEDLRRYGFGPERQFERLLAFHSLGADLDSSETSAPRSVAPGKSRSIMMSGSTLLKAEP
jgi:hypothetical protein